MGRTPVASAKRRVSSESVGVPADQPWIRFLPKMSRFGGTSSGSADAPMTKIWFSELNLEMSSFAMSLQGASGTLLPGDPRAVDRGYWQDSFLYARAWTIAGGSNEIMRNLIAERGLGLPREPRGT